MIMRKGIYLIVMCLSFIFGCQAKSGFTSVDAKTFAVEIAKPQVQLVDVRTAEEYQQGHIPAAVNIDVNSPDFDSRIAELDKEGLAFDRNLKVGMMIETPASVLLADEFAQMADFFSIGTNDLTQYIMAADRGNADIAGLYDPHSEAVTKAIEIVIKAADKAGIEISMCGEYAADPNAKELLLKLGLRKFSVSAPAIRRFKMN